jgi:hypothetical protein
MKFILFDKIRIGDIDEAKRFYFEYLFTFAKKLYPNEWEVRHNKFILIINNPNLTRTYDYVIKSEEIFQQFTYLFEKSLLISSPFPVDDFVVDNLEEKLYFTYFNNDYSLNRSNNDLVNNSFSYMSKKQSTTESLKERIPLLRSFNPSYTKKVNIDKKILRKFKNFLKENLELINNPDIDQYFWTKFLKESLFPPMKYIDQNNKVYEFKSFNLKYLAWLFNINGCLSLYDTFLLKEGKETLDSIINDYELEERESEKEQLQFYYYHIAEVFYNYEKERQKFPPQIEAPPLYEEDKGFKMYETYIGQTFNMNTNKIDDLFSLMKR